MTITISIFRLLRYQSNPKKSISSTIYLVFCIFTIAFHFQQLHSVILNESSPPSPTINHSTHSILLILFYSYLSITSSHFYFTLYFFATSFFSFAISFFIPMGNQYSFSFQQEFPNYSSSHPPLFVIILYIEHLIYTVYFPDESIKLKWRYVCCCRSSG